MSDVLLVQNNGKEGSGYLGDLLKEDGFDIHLVNGKYEKLPEKKYSLVVILGAPESANDDLPYLQEEQKLIKKSVEENIPVTSVLCGFVSTSIISTSRARPTSGP